LKDEAVTLNQKSARIWVQIEIYAFYLNIIASILFLFYTSIKGSLGLSNEESSLYRYNEEGIQ